MTRAFPELASDLDGIRGAWFLGERRHRAMLLMLRTPGLEAQRLRLGEGASGRAALERTTVLLRRPYAGQADPILLEAQLQSAIAVPLIHDARLVGTLAVGSSIRSRSNESTSATPSWPARWS